MFESIIGTVVAILGFFGVSFVIEKTPIKINPLSIIKKFFNFALFLISKYRVHNVLFHNFTTSILFTPILYYFSPCLSRVFCEIYVKIMWNISGLLCFFGEIFFTKISPNFHTIFTKVEAPRSQSRVAGHAVCVQNVKFWWKKFHTIFTKRKAGRIDSIRPAQ